MHSEARNNLKKTKKRALRVRKKLRGDSERPRLSVVKTNRHIIAQLINDETGHTIASVSTQDKASVEAKHNRKNCDTAKQLGKALSQKATQQNVEKARFDRGSHKYHGLIKAFAEGVREGGLKV